MMPAFIVIVLVLVVYCFLRTVISVVKELSNGSQAAHAMFHMDYRWK
jgi:hypothetical protein